MSLLTQTSTANFLQFLFHKTAASLTQSSPTSYPRTHAAHQLLCLAENFWAAGMIYLTSAELALPENSYLTVRLGTNLITTWAHMHAHAFECGAHASRQVLRQSDPRGDVIAVYTFEGVKQCSDI